MILLILKIKKHFNFVITEIGFQTYFYGKYSFFFIILALFDLKTKPENLHKSEKMHSARKIENIVRS